MTIFRINFFRAWAAVLGALALALAAGVVHAQTGSSGQPAWAVELRKELPEHDPPSYRAYITAGTNKFALLVPAGFSAQGGGGDAVLRLANADGSSQITFALRLQTDPRYADNDSVRDFLLASHPGAKITAEAPVGVNRWTGRGFDLEWRSSSGNAQSGRTVVVPMEGGSLEFTATTSPGNFPVVHASLDRFIRSILVAKDGKLDVPHLSGKY